MTGELTKCVAAGDEAGLLSLLSRLPEPERRKLAKEAAAAVKTFHKGDWVTETQGTSEVSHWKSPYSPAQQKCALLAALGTCSASELRLLTKAHRLPLEVVGLWRATKPSFIREAAEIVVEASFNWMLARTLVREGLSARPTRDEYTLGLLGPEFGEHWRRQRVPLAERVLADPEMLKEEIWRLFEVEGGGETSLATHDKYRGDWGPTFITLMNGGYLPRERLLDASLGALERDFAAFRVGWFSRFHEMLEPTVDERRLRLPVYARLLASSIPATSSFALRAIKLVDAATPIAPSSLLPYAARVLTGADKGPAKEMLSLLMTMAKREPSAGNAIGAEAVLGLSHEDKGVQKAALDLLDVLEPGMDAVVRASVTERAADVAPSLRKRALKWGGKEKAVAQASVLSSERPERAERAAVVPIATVDELVDVCAHVIEDDGDPLLVELALDGISRLCADRPADFALRTGPLTKRARRVAEREGHPLAEHVAKLVLAWTLREAPPAFTRWNPQADVTIDDFFAKRAHEVATRVAKGEARALLSLPTHRPAWIDGPTLAARVQALARGESPPPLDAVLALLRLEPAHRATTLASCERLRPYDRGDASEPHAPLEFSIFNGTYPLGIAYQRLVVSGGTEAPPPVGEPTTILESRPPCIGSGTGGSEKHVVRWAATVWPARMEVFLAEGARCLGNNVDWHTAYWANSAYLEPLRDPEMVLGPMAVLLLVLGLAAKEPGESALAVDSAIAVLEQGRLSGRAIGATMARLLPTGFVKGKRWARTLAVVATASPRCAREVRVAIQCAFRGDPTKGPRDEGALVDLLAELLADVDEPIDDAEAWAYLSTGRHARRIAALGRVLSG